MLVNIECLTHACANLSIPFEFIDENHNVVQVRIQNNYRYFVNSTAPFNREDIEAIGKDKNFTYNILSPIMKIPYTLSFLDPFCSAEYRKYLKAFSYNEIRDAMLKKLELPFIVKRNAGSRGVNVFLCKNRKELDNAIISIFDQKSKSYDFVLLGQEYVRFKKEYRVLVFNRNVVLMYLKDTSEGEFIGNLSPLHWKNSKAVFIKDADFKGKVHNFIQPIFSKLDIVYAGFDIGEDEEGNLWLIEINTKPGFEHFVKDNGKDDLVKMYEGILRTYLSR